VTRWALLADVHGNLEALEAVLAHLRGWPGAQLVSAGDLVGYGADPEACIELVRARDAVCVAGNHEAMVLGELGFDRCVHAGIRAALWTRRALSADARAWLAGLPRTREAPGGLMVCHGCLEDPEFYVSTPAHAESALARLAREHRGARVLVCGHTHRPMLHVAGAPRPVPVGVALAVPRGARCLVNPGAVGQSRDGRPLARYARYDDDLGTVTFFELAYDDQRTCEKLRRAGLVARVAFRPPRGMRRHLERLRNRWARWAVRRAAATAGARRRR
jgi:diadenosine tetraphosphatase ApaH/serine/threonine PP2A family protein phosphatase